MTFFQTLFTVRSCFQALQRNLKKADKKSPGLLPVLARFVKVNRKCTGCKQYNTGHNRAGCPKLSKNTTKKKKRVKLMELKDRDQGNKRCEEWLEYTKEFCDKKGDD